jgi:hypothetical protein
MLLVLLVLVLLMGLVWPRRLSVVALSVGGQHAFGHCGADFFEQQRLKRVAVKRGVGEASRHHRARRRRVRH